MTDPNSFVTLPVFLVIHGWTIIRDGHEESSSCEVIAIHSDDVSAMACRDKTILAICERRRAEKYRFEVRRDSSGDAFIHAQPEKEWFRSYRRDYVIIEEKTMPVPESVLTELLHKEDPHAE